MQPLRLAVVGSLNMDLVVRVPHLPRPGETVAGEDLLRAAGGKGANQAVAAARLGGSVTMIGRVGRDAFGRELSRGLRAEGVSTRWVLGSDRPTGAALILVDEGGENTIAVAPGANSDLLPEDIPRRVIETAEVVVAPLEVPLATIEETFRLAHLAGVRTMLNAAPARPVGRSLLELSDVVICNEIELATMLGHPDVTAPEAKAAQMLRVSADQVVVVTLGPRGAVGVLGDDVVERPTFPVPVLDTVGAGDAFVAAFAMARWWSSGLRHALEWGCAAGALATTVAGAQPSMPTLARLEALLNVSRR